MSELPAERQSDDKTTEIVVGYILRIGVIASASLVSIGGVWYLIQHGLKHPSYARFLSEPSDLLSYRATLREAGQFDSAAVIMTGLLVLIATPILRVAFTIVAFAHEKDWIYVAAAAFVLAVLLFSIAH